MTKEIFIVEFTETLFAMAFAEREPPGTPSRMRLLVGWPAGCGSVIWVSGFGPALNSTVLRESGTGPARGNYFLYFFCIFCMFLYFL